MAFAATTRVRHTGKGGNAVRPRRRWLMSTERHRKVASCAATPSSSKEVDGAVGFPPVGRRVNRECGGAVVPKRSTSAATSF